MISHPQFLTLPIKIHSPFKVTQDTSSEDWQRLQSSLPDLTALSDIHDDDKIRKLARRLKKLVATHGVILEQSSNIKSKCREMSDRTEQEPDSFENFWL